MRKIFSKWIDRYFSDEEALFLFLLLAGLAYAVVRLLFIGVGKLLDKLDPS